MPIRIMVVDDHPAARAGLKAVLEADPALSVIAEAATAAEAFELLDSNVDLVLMDLSLPDLSGALAAERILAEWPHVKVLIFSAHSDPALARAMIEAGAAGYALKGSDCDELTRAVHQVMKGTPYLSPGVAPRLPLHRRSLSPPAPRSAKLSQREVEVVRRIALGETAKEVADALGLSPRTLETYKARAMTKLDLHTRAQLVQHAIRRGWLTGE